jgi:SAM-dependent methyltransferase
MNNDSTTSANDLRKEQVIRQDRISACLIDAFLKIGSESFEVYDCTSFGVSIYSNRAFSAQESFKDALFQIEGITTQELSLKVARSEQLFDKRFKVAFEIKSTPLDISAISAVHHTKELLHKFSQSVELVDSIPKKFRQQTLELKDYLYSLKAVTETLEQRLVSTSITNTREAEDVAAKVLSQFIQKVIEPQVEELSLSLKNISEETTKLAYEFFRETVGPIIYTAPFAERSFKKPLGYAGDFDMMNMIYRNEPLGKTLIGKGLHQCLISMSGAKAVRNRAVYLRDKLVSELKKKKSIRSLSVASGPAMELQMLLKEDLNLEGCDLHLLDQDLSSLKYAQKTLHSINIDKQKKANFEFFNTNIRSVIAHGLPQSSYDVIYSAGLFDYFNDSVARRAAEQLFASLKTDGVLIIGNFDINNPSRLLMELALDWNLIYRTKDDLNRIFSSLGKHQKVETELENVNLFYVIHK